jgi:voltage-gated potassium channel
MPDQPQPSAHFSLGEWAVPRPRGRRAIFRGQLLFFLRRLAILGALIVAVLGVGTAGFVLTEDTSVGYGFLWALDTVSTVGSISDPPSSGGRAVKVILIVLGLGTLFYALVTAAEFFVAGRLSGLLEDRRTLRMIDSLSDHILICGFGRVGRQVARDLKTAGRRFVVIDSNAENRAHADALGAPFIEGPPSDDGVLREAGIERAAGVLACIDSDPENIFTTLTARELRPDITIVARAAVEDSEKKLKRAGADRIVSPYKASGTEMARLALSPQVAGALDVSPEYRMEEIEVSPGCEAVGKTLGEVRGSSIVVAVRPGGGSVQPQPPVDHVLEVGDVLVAMGEPTALRRLESLLAAAPAA